MPYFGVKINISPVLFWGKHGSHKKFHYYRIFAICNFILFALRYLVLLAIRYALFGITCRPAARKVYLPQRRRKV